MPERCDRKTMLIPPCIPHHERAPRLPIRRILLVLSAIAFLFAAAAFRPVAAASLASGVPRESGTTLGTVSLFAPEMPARALVYIVSDADGWNVALDEAAGRLAATGMLAIGIDLRHWSTRLGAEGGCLYLIPDLEEVSKRLQRELGLKGYLSPIVAGIGAGGTLAYAALAQSPAATIKGAVSLDPAPTLAAPKPLCAGAPATGAGEGAWSYGRRDTLPGWWRLGLRGTAANPFPWADDVEAGGTVPLPAGLPLADALERLLVPAVDEATGRDHGLLADLPIIELPASGSPRMLAVVLSGDGGWRDVDKQVAQTLSERGIGVIGLDSLRYFWQRRTPEGLAADLVRIYGHYAEVWDVRPLLLVGYSFGADVLPAAVNRLPPTVLERVVQISLLGLSASADYEFHVAGWFGVEATDALPVASEVARLDPARVQCFYGEEEAESLCPDPVFDHAERVRTRGGHHFDGDYEALAGRILEGAGRRLERRS
jgi:type IV secretory pathway VirJ component